MNEIALCLPKGENMNLVAKHLSSINFPIEGYSPGNRSYRPVISKEGVRAKIFAEKDVVMQVAVGNYSMGFCGSDWIEEFITRFPQSEIRIWKRLQGVTKGIYACCHSSSGWSALGEMNARNKVIRIASEYPNLAEAFALKNLFKRYRVFTLWGSVEAYPPEHAEIIVMAAKDRDALSSLGLKPIELLLDAQLCIVVNKREYESKDLSSLLSHFCSIEGG